MSTLRYINGRVKNRRDDKDVLAEKNPLLYDGELCIEQDLSRGKFKMKCGDGVTRYNDLPYISGGGGITGEVTAYAGKVVPEDWLLCNGQAVSRTEYPDLFECIGTMYGAGDGTSTFNVPNLEDLFIQCTTNADNIAKKRDAGIPNITGSFATDDYYSWGQPPIGCFYTDRWINTRDAKSQHWYMAGISMDASRSSPVYGRSDTVQPPSILMYYIIHV